MKYIKQDEHLRDAECSNDAVKSSELLLGRLAELHMELDNLTTDQPKERAKALLDAGYILLDLERADEAWGMAREAFELCVPVEDWEQAVQACDIMSQTDHPDAIKALAHGVWLGVTYPVDPELSVAVLQRLIEETPDKSDGTAVAAAASRYLVDLRAEGKQREDLQFFTGQMLGNVARAHSNVDNQEIFDFWMDRLELNDPQQVLSRLARILDVLVTDGWWYDRDVLRERLPAS